MLRFALRELLLRPMAVLFIGGAIWCFTLVTATVLALGGALSYSASAVALREPAVVVKRADGGPVPIGDTVGRLSRIPGVLGVWPRIHGERRLAADEADDLALSVFHPIEAEAILPELRDTLPFEAVFVTRSSGAAFVEGRVSRRLGLWMLLLAPSLLALVYIVSVQLRTESGELNALGIQKAVGWGTGELFRFHLIRVALLGMPPAIIGGLLASALFFVADSPSVRLFFLGPGENDFPLSVSLYGTARAILGAVMVVMLPLCAAALVQAARGVLAEPVTLLRRSGR